MKHERNTILSQTPMPFNSRPYDKIEMRYMDILVKNFTEKVYKILKESYDGYTYHNCTDLCLTYANNAPASVNGPAHRRTWIWFMRYVPGIHLHAVGLELLIRRDGNDVNNWSIEKIYYSKTVFDSIEEFIESYENGRVKKVFFPAPTKEELLFSTLKRRGENTQPALPLREPQQYEPDGKRYTINDNHVEYMGWSFDFRVRTTSGPQLFDIRFNGERIVYELSIQEAGAFYGGYSPKPSYTGYLDSAWAMGTTFELVKGVDCPNTATYVDLIVYAETSKPSVRRNGLCIFELNTGTPIRRHHEGDGNSYAFYGGMPGVLLTVRAIVTAFNYDYIYDYIFYPNGVMEVKLSTTGYIQPSYWTPEEGDYGTEVHKAVAGNVHDHLAHFKVDLDVGGRKNSYETVEVKVENISSKWFPNQRHLQKYVVRETKKTEKEAAYKFNFKRPSYLNFYNPSKKDIEGVERGYRIHLSGIINQLYPEHWAFTNGFHWSFYQMAVTKYKWNEDRSSSIYNQNDVYNPVVNFGKFIEDDENIENEDLVSWVSIGLMHIPHNEDIPNTATPGNNAGFFLRPFNYFDEDPSIASQDSVFITPTADSSKVERPGRSGETKCIPRGKPISYSGRQEL